MTALLLTLALLAGAFVGFGYLFDRHVRPAITPKVCTATYEDLEVRLSHEQARNAALIAAVAVERGLPARAVTIALATAYQESKIVNINYGDRDSLGLFQQRPSQGWGTEEEIMDPIYSTNAFYDGLVKVKNYRELDVTVAAQKVQRSAFPNAYADHESDARVLASALTGQTTAAFTCTVDGNVTDLAENLLPSGLTPRAEAVLDDVRAVWGKQSVGGFEPKGVTDGHMSGSAHYTGRAVDIFFRPVNDANNARGWAMAHYLVAHASRLDIATVIFDDRIWQARRSSEGWRDYRVPASSKGDRAILEHRDHVHVDVFR
ncbi:hypothetical protein [Nocardioides yefusunii]|uniref:ARB-07466-like C-terminal domain-containing protein n=1 Tax=Nocardioides yefusunii TaxID=2500546 RepID=A0ABW1QSZ9_9ACTN|nr:hypothetical protein [Nocardioides yefusunii]